MELAAAQLINGLSLGSILLLLAFGLNVTFGMMGIINFAHGEFMMLGAYTTYLFQVWTIKALGDAAYFLSIPLAFVMVAGFGLVVERTMIRRLYGNAYGSILVTWGLSLIIMQLLRVCFGHNNVQIVSPRIFSTGLALSATLQIPLARLFIFLLSVTVVAAMCVLLYRTRIGR